jgi:ribosomal-protein-alanine N-acetyltransferase
VAEQKGRVCGYIVACNRGETAELVSIAVMPAVRAKGAAQALMDSTIRRLKLRHVAVLRLMVKTGNARALRFYEKYGFQHRRRVPAYYEDGSDGLLMYRAL